jgi:hypothetical protein
VDTPFLYILDIRNFTWVTRFEPNTTDIISTTTEIAPSSTQTNLPTNLPSKDGKKIGIISGIAVSSVIGVSIVGFFCYKLYKKRKRIRGVPTPGSGRL